MVKAGSPARKLGMVSDEEIAEAVCVVLGRSYGIAREQASAPSAKLLGYNRNTEAIKDRMDGVIAALLSEGRLEDDGDHMVLGTSSEN